MPKSRLVDFGNYQNRGLSILVIAFSGEVDFLVAKDREPLMLVECKSSVSEPLSRSLVEFQKSLSVPYAFQVAVDAPLGGIDPTEYKGRAIKMSVLDLMRMLV